jgi:hypothetical protein
MEWTVLGVFLAIVFVAFARDRAYARRHAKQRRQYLPKHGVYVTASYTQAADNNAWEA